MSGTDGIAGWLNGLTGLAFSGHGWLAAALGLVGVFGIYAALLYLVRLSHRTGHDRTVEDYRDPRWPSASRDRDGEHDGTSDTDDRRGG